MIFEHIKKNFFKSIWEKILENFNMWGHLIHVIVDEMFLFQDTFPALKIPGFASVCVMLMEVTFFINRCPWLKPKTRGPGVMGITTCRVLSNGNKQKKPAWWDNYTINLEA